jgi:hypothetical protein
MSWPEWRKRFVLHSAYDRKQGLPQTEPFSIVKNSVADLIAYSAGLFNTSTVYGEIQPSVSTVIRKLAGLSTASISAKSTLRSAQNEASFRGSPAPHAGLKSLGIMAERGGTRWVTCTQLGSQCIHFKAGARNVGLLQRVTSAWARRRG